MAVLKTFLFVLFFIFQYGIMRAQFHSNLSGIINSKKYFSIYKPNFPISNKLFYDYLNNPNISLQNPSTHTKAKDSITSPHKIQTSKKEGITNTKENIRDLPVNDKLLSDLRNHPFEKRNSWDNPSGAESMENAIFSGSFDFILDLFLK